MLEPAPSVLFIDDDPLMHEFYELFAEAFHYKARFVYTGREGLLAALEARPEVIVLDWHMPGLIGGQVLQYLRAEPQLADVPVIFLTAQPPDTIEQTPGTPEAPVDYLFKPVDKNVLKGKIEQRVVESRERRGQGTGDGGQGSGQ